jgi:hypothetical protein
MWRWFALALVAAIPEDDAPAADLPGGGVFHTTAEEIAAEGRPGT